MIELLGSKDKVIFTLCKIGIKDSQDAQAILDYLCKNPNLLDEFESIEIEEYDNDGQQMALTMFNSSLYINVKTMTIVMIAFLLDINLTSGIAALSLSLLGVNNQALATISDDGEKCVLRETLLRKPRIGDANILKSYKGKCQRINSQCKFRNGELCNCSQNAIINIYENLTEKSIFKRSEDRKRYIYQW